MTMGDDLLGQVRAALGDQGVVATAPLAERVYAELENRYRVDRGSACWWSTSFEHQRRVVYSGDGANEVRSEVANWGIFLVVITDEAPDPCGVLVTDEAGLLAALRGCRYFEYALVRADFGAVVWDTHHNELLVWTEGPARRA